MGSRFHEMEQESVVPPQGRGVRYRVGVGGVLILTAYCDRGIPRRSVSVAESDFSPEDVRYLERWLDSHYPAASRLKLMA